MSLNATQSLLNGVKVLDLSQYIPGPYSSMKMLNLGAQVIKVEPPGGDPMRHFGAEGEGLSPLYVHLNRGKKIVALDLKTESGREQFTRLLKDADVLIEGFRPGTLQRLGYSMETLHGINQRLIVCSLSGFGQQGRLAPRSGHDLGYAARAGLFSRASDHSRPQPVYPPVADHASALDALFMICAALLRRALDGSGCVLDVSMHGTLEDWQYMFKSEAVCRHLSGDIACYNIYQTSDDRFVSLAALEPKFWTAFCNAVGRLDWIERHAEPAPQDDLIGELQTMFMGWPQYHWKEKLEEVDCCFEAIPAPEELLDGAEYSHPGAAMDARDLDFTEDKTICWSLA